MATAQISTAVLLQIDQIFHHWKSSKYLITLNWKILKLRIAFLHIFRRFIWLLDKAQFFGYCASIILQLRIPQLFIYCKSTNYFTTGNRLYIWLLCIEKLYDNFTLPIWKHFEDLYRFCAKAQFLGHYASMILLLRISQLFMNCK